MENRRSLILISLFVLSALTLGKSGYAQVKEATQVPDIIIVVFQGQPLPADAADRVLQAGGKVTGSLDAVGILVASTGSVVGDRVIPNLRKDIAIVVADYCRGLQVIAPVQVDTEY